jgi:hypothetical protein
MAIAPHGTFDYVAVVPERLSENGFECRATLREPIDSTGDDVWDGRLVGHEPLFRVSDAGLTPDPGEKRPRVMRSLISLVASERRRATIATASFHVDKALMSSLRSGDLVHVTYTDCCGLGLSVLRQGALVVAAGAVTAVPLGNDVEARIPGDLIDRAEAIFRSVDDEFEFLETPIEIRVAASRVLLLAGYRTRMGHDMYVVHGFQPGEPGNSECAAIYQRALCPETAAHASALLLDLPEALSMTRW